MRTTLVYLFSAILALLVPAQLSAKGHNVRITIKGGTLTVPVEITDPEVFARFEVGHGPGNIRTLPDGTGMPSYSPQGFVVDWSSGAVEPPKNLPIYDVSFVTTRTDRSTYRPLHNSRSAYEPGIRIHPRTRGCGLPGQRLDDSARSGGSLVSRLERMGTGGASSDREWSKGAPGFTSREELSPSAPVLLGAGKE